MQFDRLLASKNPIIREYIKCKSIILNTMKGYMSKLTKKVETRLQVAMS